MRIQTIALAFVAAFAAPLLAQDADRGSKFVAKKDANGDGKLSADELGVERHIFRVLDKNGDGFVTADEVQAPKRAPKKIKKKRGAGDRMRGPSPEQMQKMAAGIIKRLDKDGDGKLNADEIAAAKSRDGKRPDKRPEGDRPEGKRGAPMRRRGPDLSKADKNGDGFVDAGEIVKVLATARRRGGDNPRMLKRLIERMDANKDGKLEEAEWKGRKQMFAQLDSNGDKVVTAEEIEAAVQKMQAWRGRAGEAMFRRMDANQDGRLTKEEWKLGAAFERFDRNKDGFISADEVLLMHRRSRRGPDGRAGKGPAHFLEKFDKNKDGVVGKDEFPHERRFAEMDADGNGSLSKAEIEEAMDKRMRESRVGFFERFDVNGDGKVTREEFTGSASDFDAKDGNKDGVIDAADKPDGK